MWFFYFGLFILYCIATWHSLRQASSPDLPCFANDNGNNDKQPHNRQCYRPLVRVGDELSMQLWLYQPKKKNDTAKEESSGSSYSSLSESFHWTPVETCQFSITIPETGQLPRLITANNNNNNNTDITTNNNNKCLVPLPDVARQRSTKNNSPLRARLVFSSDNNNHNKVLAVAPLELTRIVTRRRTTARNLWSSSSSSTAATDEKNQSNTSNNNNNKDESSSTRWDVVPYYKYGRAAVRIRIVAEDRPYGANLLRSDGMRLRAWNQTHYAPHIYVDDLSLPRRRRGQSELALPQHNKPPVELHIKLSSLTPLMDCINQQVHQALDVAQELLGNNNDDDENNGSLDDEGLLDDIRYFLADERLYRFFLTQIISYLHMFLDYLAFRDEIQFYNRGKQNLSGVSTTTVVTRMACSLIILLYLIDGGGTSWVILLSMAASCAVEAWKVWKLTRPTWQPHFPFVALRQLQTQQEKQAAEYDRIAMTRLGMVLYPLVIAWSFYSLRQNEYKSWYSWLISNLANAVYTFGFISLCPQLYVNYRLKSVAHLPWKVFVYKIFNTFVDDAFAFLIEMPWKHRLMTLRDDVVFLIFLVQFFMYRVDKTRTNEFGYSYQEEKVDHNESDTNQKIAREQVTNCPSSLSAGDMPYDQPGKVKEE